MRSILLDESVPLGLAKILESETRSVTHVSRVGFAGTLDHDLMRAASRRGIDVFVTCDQSPVRQQNVSSLPFGIVVICTNNWNTILVNRSLIGFNVDQVQPGAVVSVLEATHLTRYGRRPTTTDPSD